MAIKKKSKSIIGYGLIDVEAVNYIEDCDATPPLIKCCYTIRKEKYTTVKRISRQNKQHESPKSQGQIYQGALITENNENTQLW